MIFGGEIKAIDLYEAVHLLIGGAPNMGKSVALYCLVCSITYYRSAREVQFILIDIGANSLDVFEKLPHLAEPIIKDVTEGIRVILSLEKELNARIDNSGDARMKLPAIVCVIDEFVSFIQSIDDPKLSKRVKIAIENLLRRGRHANIHMVLATQDATFKSTHINLGSVKTRMSFSCPSHHESMVILGMPGAETLTEQGSLLLIPPGCSKPSQLNGPYISEGGVENFVDEISTQHQNLIGKYGLLEWKLPDLSDDTDMTFENRSPPKQEQRSEELCRIILWALGQDQVSRLEIVKTFRIGKRANEIFRKLIEWGIVDDNQSANQPSTVLPRLVEDLSDETMAFLIKNRISADEIEEALQRRPEPNLNTLGTEGVSDELALEALHYCSNIKSFNISTLLSIQK